MRRSYRHFLLVLCCGLVLALLLGLRQAASPLVIDPRPGTGPTPTTQYTVPWLPFVVHDAAGTTYCVTNVRAAILPPFLAGPADTGITKRAVQAFVPFVASDAAGTSYCVTNAPGHIWQPFLSAVEATTTPTITHAPVGRFSNFGQPPPVPASTLGGYGQ